MDSLTDIFALLAITLLLNIIDYRQYPGMFAPPSEREKQEIHLAQLDAFMLVEFLNRMIDLVDDGTREYLSVEYIFFSYFIQQRKWLLTQLKPASHVQQDDIKRRISDAAFLWGNNPSEVLKGEIWEEWAGEGYCFTPLNEALDVRFPDLTQGNMKKKITFTKCPSNKRSKRVNVE